MKFSLPCLAAVALLATVTPAHAGLTFDFQDTGPGTKSNSMTFSANVSPGVYNTAFQIKATANAGDLYVKHQGGDENGLGLTSDSSGEHEITKGNYIDFNIGALKSKYNIQTFTFLLGSVTGPDQYEIDAVNANGTIGAVLGTNLTASSFALTTSNIASYDTFRVAGVGGNVLVNAISANGTAVPEPASLAMTAVGAFAAFAGYRIKRRKATTA